MKKHLGLSLITLFACASAGTLSAVSPSDVYDDPLIALQWQWDPEQGGINIADVWERGITGSGVVIGICDQWVEPFHEDLNVSAYNTATNWKNADLSLGLSYDFRNPGFSPSPTDEQPYTKHGHGTACAGMAAASANDIGTVGAAPGATIAGLHIANESGGLHFESAAQYWGSGVDSQGKYIGEAQIDVKSCSFGSSYSNPSGTNSGVELTAANNVIYCFSSGNDDSTTGWRSYNNIKEAITVGNATSWGVRSGSSNYGSNVFIIAPGTSVYSTDRTGDIGYDGSNYTSWSGTSASTPLVAGVMALGKQICPDMDVRWARHALAWASGHNDNPNIDADDSSDTGSWQKNNGGYWFNNNYGFGMVDAVGFVDAAQNILYTTTETTFTQSDAGKIKKTDASETTGTTRFADFSVETGAGALSQDIETVAVKINFSAAAQTLLDWATLKITLFSPDDLSSVVVQGEVNGVDVLSPSYYTFRSNAFWGSTYGAEDWRVLVEYGAEDGVDTTGWVTVGSVEFTMGDVVFEAEDRSIAAGEVVTAHAIALDSGSFSVAGTMRLEDSVLINKGSFELAETGSIAAYTEGVFGASKGLKYTQNGGDATIRGNVTFKRGATLNNGNLNLYNTISTGTGMIVHGGALTIGQSADAISVGNTLPVYGGKVVLAENSVFDTELNAEGGAIELRDGATANKKISVGKNAASGNEAAIGGSLEASGTVYAKGGIEISGTASGVFAENTSIKSGALTLSGGSVVWSGLLSVDGGITVDGGALGSTVGNVALYGGILTGTGTLGICEDASVTITEDATFVIGNSTIDLASNSLLRLEAKVDGSDTFAGALSGSGKLMLTQDTNFAADIENFAGTLAIENGVLSVGSDNSLTLINNTTLELNVSDASDWLSVNVASGGSVSFADGAKLVVNFSGTLDATSVFTVMTWEDASAVSGLADLERGNGISLHFGGVEYDKDNWYFEIADNSLKLNLSVAVIDVAGSDQNAELFVKEGTDYVANLLVDEYRGTISGSGSVNSVGDLVFAGNFGDLEGTVYISGGTFAATADSDLGDEKVSYVVDGSGALSIESAADSERDFGNKLSGGGEFRTEGMITLSGDASGFSGKTSVAAGILTVAETAQLGSGVFDVAGTLVLKGSREFANATTGTGTLSLASGTTTFTKNVGTAGFEISENAEAKFTGVGNGFAGKLSGKGSLTTTQNFALSGDASEFEGKTSITAGTFSVAKDAKLGTGAFEIAGTLSLNGNRSFGNETSGTGTLNVASGTTTFTKNVGTAELDISENAQADFAGKSDGFAGKLSGAGVLTTTRDFTLSGDASEFNGKISVVAGTLSIPESTALGAGTFDISGTLELNGDRVFSCETDGKGALKLLSGKTTFAVNVGTAVFDISEKAIAEFTEETTEFAGILKGAGELNLPQDFVLSGDVSEFSGKMNVESGTLAITEVSNVGSGVSFDVADTLNLGGKGEFSSHISGEGTLSVSGEVTFAADASHFSGTTHVEEGGSLLLAESASTKLGSGDFAVYGEMEIAGTRRIENDVRGSGTLVLGSDSDVSFVAPVEVKVLKVESGATLRGDVSMTYGSGSRLLLAGNLTLKQSEDVSLGGARVVLDETASLTLESDLPETRVRLSGGGNAQPDFNQEISIFKGGIIQGDVEAFLKSDDLLSAWAEKAMVIYDLEKGLSVRVSPGIETSVNINTEGFCSSFLDWSMKDLRETFDRLQVGFWNSADPVFSGGNDPLMKAVLSGEAGEARAILDRLSPKSYAAMVAMSAEALHSDVQSVSSRLEQRRYDGYSEDARWEFFAQGQGNSAENDTASDSPSFDFNTNGVFAGADYKTNADTIIGLAVGVSRGKADIHNGGGKIEASDFRFTAYAGKTLLERFYVNAGAQLSYANYDIKRKTDYGNPTADTHGLTGAVFAETGALLTLSEKNKIYAMPYVGLAYSHTQIEAFGETGSDKAFDTDTIKGDSLRARIGCGLSWGFDVAGTTWRVGLDAAYSHDFAGDEVDVDVATKNGDTISETAQALPEDVFSVGPTLNVDLNSTMSLYGGYTFNAGTDSYTNHTANVGFRMRF